jgi:hypothetical protein
MKIGGISVSEGNRRIAVQYKRIAVRVPENKCSSMNQDERFVRFEHFSCDYFWQNLPSSDF